MRRLTPLIGVVSIAVTGVILALPLLVHGLLPSGRDSTHHLIWYRHFSEQFWAGDWYPRWLLGINSGLGGPPFYVYGPFTHLSASLLEPLAGTGGFGGREFLALDLSLAVGLILSGLAGWLWLRSIVPDGAAILAALVYMGLPYHLWADLYVRAALAEFWSFVWIPLILYFAGAAVRSRRWALAGLSSSYCLLVMTHVFTALIFTPVPILYVLFVAGKGSRRAGLLRVSAGLALGAGLSAIYLVPAVVHEKYVPAKMLINVPSYDYRVNFLVTDRSIFVWDPLKNMFNWYASWIAAGAVLMAGMGFAAGRNGGPVWRRTGVFWLSVSLGSLYMMTPWSQWLWHLLPPLHGMIFPWRFLVILTVSAAFLLAYGLARRRDASGWRKYCLVTAAVATALMCLGPYFHVWKLYGHQTRLPEFEEELRAGADLYRRVYAQWTPPEMLMPASIERIGRDQPRASIRSGEGRVSVLRWAAGDILLRVESAGDVEVVVAQFYYPAWTAESETGDVLVPEPSTPEGLVRLRVPSGTQSIRLYLPARAEKLGLAITLLSLLLVTALSLLPVRRPGIGGQTADNTTAPHNPSQGDRS